MDFSPFSKRRARLMKQMGRGIAVIPTASEPVRYCDTHHRYRADSYFHYLTGVGEPEREVWDGFRWGPDAAREAFGCDIITHEAPKTIADIGLLMRESRNV